MTSNTLSNNSFQNNSGRFQVNFLQQFSALKQYHWLFLLCFVVIGCATTLPVLIQLIDQLQSTSSKGSYTHYIVTSNGALALCMYALPLVTGNVMFRYLNQKAEVDFFHSLPQTKEHIFITRFVTGVLCLLIPLVIHGFLSYGLTCLGAYQNTPTLGQMANIWGELFLRSLSIYSFIVLGTVLTGNTFLAFCTAVGLASAPVALCFVYMTLCDKFYNFFTNDWDFLLSLAQSTCPFADIFLYGDLQSAPMDCLLQVLVIGGLGFYCYGKRPSEHSGTPVVLGVWKFIIKGLGVVCGGSLCGLIIMEMLSGGAVGNYIMGSLFFCLLLHVAFEMLFDMDVKAGFRNMKQFALLYGIVAVSGIAIAVDVTGYDSRLAPIEKISSIEWDGTVFTEPENIAILHQSMEHGMDIYGEDLDIARYQQYTVNLTQGTSYKRQYNGGFVKGDYLKLTSSLEYVLQSHSYDMAAEDLQELEDLAAQNIFYSNVYGSDYDKKLQYTDFENVYHLILQDLPLLTEEYLAENVPVVHINVYCDNAITRDVPLYECMEEALAFLDLPPVDLTGEDYGEYATLYTATEKIGFHTLDPLLQEMILESLTPLHNEGWSYYESYGKNLVEFRKYGNLYGYMSYEDYDAVLEAYEKLK